jgi:signal transduction histidine kinase
MLDHRSRQLALMRSERLATAGQLTAGLAHDFNNILMIIDGFSQRILNLAGDSPPIEASVKQIMMATDKAKFLTQSLLAFSRQQPLQNRVFCANTAIHENAPLLAQALDARFEIRFELNAKDVNIETDTQEFGQALLNLVVNARDAMSAKGGTIIVGTRITTHDEITGTTSEDLEPGQYVEVHVLDHGSGMTDQV